MITMITIWYIRWLLLSSDYDYYYYLVITI